MLESEIRQMVLLHIHHKISLIPNVLPYLKTTDDPIFEILFEKALFLK